jgi:hypothetical protein
MNFEDKNVSNATSKNLSRSYNYSLAIIGSEYLLSIICALGIITNVVCLLVFLSPRLREEVYKHLIVKTSLEILVLFSSFMALFIRCTSCATYQTVFAYIMRILFLQFFNNVAYTCSSWCEVSICYDRLLILNRGTRRQRMPIVPFKWTTAINLGLSVLTSLPFLFNKRIVPLNDHSPGKYKDELNQFGRSSFYSYYIMFIYAIQVFVPLVALLVLNVAVTIKLRRFIRRKNRLQARLGSELRTIASSSMPSNRALSRLGYYGDTNEMELCARFTRMILVSSVLFTLTRFIQGTMIILYSLLAHQPSFNVHLNIFSFLSNEVTFIYFTFNIFIYIIFNKSFADSLKSLFCQLLAFRTALK